MKSDKGVKVYTTFFKRLLLLLWKNLLFRRRQWIITSMEIILPTFLAIILAFLRTQIKDGAITHIKHNTEFLMNGESDMIAHTNIQLSCDECILAYSPVNNLTTELMKELRDRLGNEIVVLRGFDSEEEIQKYIATASINDTYSIPEIKSAIIFEEGVDENYINDELPNDFKISYKIRIPTYSMYTKDLFASFQFPGPELENTVTYLNTGFSGLQVMMDKTLISYMTKKNTTLEMTAQAFPYPAYTKVSDFTEFYSVIVPQFLILGFIFIVPSITKSVVSEKETGIKELMKLMGLPNWMHWLGWMFNSLLVLMISVSIVVFVLFYTFSELSGPVILQGDWTMWWFVLFLYVMAATASIFFITAFTDKPATATTAGIVLWLLSYYAIYKPLEERYRTLTIVKKMASCLAPNMALHWAIKVMCGLEGKGVGSKWKYFFHPNSAGDGFSTAHICFMLIVDIIVFLLLTMYVENIVPSKFGVRRPFYYIFQMSTWFTGKRRRRNLRRMSVPNIPMQSVVHGFESEPVGVTPGVAVENMSKKFATGKVAVNGISLKMYHGQITALLGHNGAGKTTTMSMLTGLFPPSTGTASVNGYDIRTDMNSVRESLGLCPQHNMLFNQLTVEEHLLFFGRLKGLSAEKARSEMTTLTSKLDLREKKYAMASSLSGGQKRKLSLGMALIGGSKVVMLDEPTSGMDPEARRIIWDLLLELRSERTIVLTTHFMEEADILGDRIAIMADGKIQCYGTPMFLKKCYGSGYSLKLTTIESSKNCSAELLQLIQKHVPTASLKQMNTQDLHITDITMPVGSTGNETSSVFPELFSELSAEKERVGIRTIGLSPATMDEVFVKIAEMTGRKADSPVTKPKLEQYLTKEGLQENGNGETENGNIKTTELNGDALVHRRSTSGSTGILKKRGSYTRKSMQDFKLRGNRLVQQQFLGFLFKKMIYTYRNRRLFITQLFVPPLLLVAAILVSTRSFTPAESSPPLKMTLSNYSSPKVLYSGEANSSFTDNYKLVAGRAALELNGDITSELIRLGLEDLGTYREEYILAGSWNDTTLHALFNTIPYHAAPLAINMLSNAYLKTLSPPEKEFKIEVTNHPLEVDVYNVLESAQPNAAFTILVPIVFGAFVPIGLALFAACFVLFPIEERVNNAKQLQLMTGASPVLFWISAFLWDFFIMAVVVCLMLIVFVVCQSYDAYTANNGLGVILIILLVYGFSAISFSYLVSLFVNIPAVGFASVSVIHISMGMIFSMIMFFLDNAEFTAKTIIIRFICRIFSTFGASLSIMRYASIATKNSRCRILPDDAKQLICYTGAAIDPLIQQCCDNCADFDNPEGPSCFEPESFFTWEYELDGAYGKNPVPGIAQEVFYMLIAALLYKFLIFCIEFGIFKKLWSLEIFSPRLLSKVDDDDVQAESKRVDDLIQEGSTSEDALVVHNISKTFGSFAAVSNMSFGVHYGECFGLLGVNGAGKTTTFRMLTGDEIITGGSAHTSLFSINNNRKTFLSRIGYCPQFDGLVGVLTGREMLSMFCRLRGVPTRFIQQETDKWLKAQGLFESGNVKCQNYSGGMKRRLSIAMAMMGDPPVILLDEPTSGVDPVARRYFWSVIAQVRGTGQCTVLTSHSMEECEALCSRLGIMVNGQLQCLGGVEHLKDKFARGYSLTLKLSHSVTSTVEEIIALKKEICELFDPCELKDEHQNVLQYQVVDMGVPWDVIFTNMENIKSKYKGIVEDYSVGQTTLEEVFLSFARKQYTSRESNISKLKRLVTCN